MEVIGLQTKQCLFCAETIQAAAVKCRFCGEFLNTGRAKAIESGSEAGSDADGDRKQTDNVLFEGRPSLWGLTPALIKALFFLGIAIFLIVYPVEELSVFAMNETSASDDYVELTDQLSDAGVAKTLPQQLPGLKLTEEQKLVFGKYRILGGSGIAALVALILLVKIVRLKCIYYQVSADRIEYSRGILDRRVDNLDMFRVIDLKMRRSLFDCIFGIGTVSLVTTDKTDPEFTFAKVRNCRRLYDVIKKASLDADQKQSVIHLE
jgi:hypothetical protein